MPSTSGPTSPPTWACGVCPVSVPTCGQACGNTPISCPYADQQCNCDRGMWTCAAPHCPAPESPDDTVAESCAGFYACNYPALQQSCTCQTPTVNGLVPDIDLKCTCPASAPPNGSDCVYPIEFTCSYSDESCTCYGGQWHCAQLCPAIAPADGTSLQLDSQLFLRQRPLLLRRLRLALLVKGSAQVRHFSGTRTLNEAWLVWGWGSFAG